MSSDIFCTSPAKTRANGVRRRENAGKAAGKGDGMPQVEEVRSGMPDRNNTDRVRRRRFPPEARHSPCRYGEVSAKPKTKGKTAETRTGNRGKGNPAPRRGVCFDVCGSARGFECHARGTQCRRLNATLHDSFARPNFTGKQAIACVPPWRRHSACSLSMNMLLMV